MSITYVIKDIMLYPMCPKTNSIENYKQNSNLNLIGFPPPHAWAERSERSERSEGVARARMESFSDVN